MKSELCAKELLCIKPGPDLFSSPGSSAEALLRNVHFALFGVFFNKNPTSVPTGVYSSGNKH